VGKIRRVIRTKSKQAYSEYKHVLAGISRSPLCWHVHRLPIRAALCCHSDNTRLANPSNSAQLGAPLPFPQVTSGPVQHCGRAAADRHRHTGRQTDRQIRVTNIHFASSTTHAQCNQLVLKMSVLSLYLNNKVMSQ